MKLPKGIDPAAIVAEATGLIKLAADREDLDNAARFDFVVDAMIDRLDALIVWPPGPVGLVAELADGPILHALRSLIAIAVQHAFDKYKAKQRAADTVPLEDDHEDDAPPVDSAPAPVGAPAVAPRPRKASR